MVIKKITTLSMISKQKPKISIMKANPLNARAMRQKAKAKQKGKKE